MVVEGEPGGQRKKKLRGGFFPMRQRKNGKDKRGNSGFSFQKPSGEEEKKKKKQKETEQVVKWGALGLEFVEKRNKLSHGTVSVKGKLVKKWKGVNRDPSKK